MTLKPPPAEIDRLRVDAHEQVYAPEPLSARRRDELGAGGWGFWISFALVAIAVSVAVLLRLLA